MILAVRRKWHRLDESEEERRMRRTIRERHLRRRRRRNESFSASISVGPRSFSESVSMSMRMQWNELEAGPVEEDWLVRIHDLIKKTLLIGDIGTGSIYFNAFAVLCELLQ